MGGHGDIGIHNPKSQIRNQVLILALYLLLSAVLTYPLVGHLGTHVPGDGGDDPALTWNLWWVPHALLRLGVNPFFCDYLFYPLGINLAFYTLTPWNALLSLPWQAMTSLVVASNVLTLLSLILSAYGAYLLARYLLPWRAARSAQAVEGAAFLAGLVYGFGSPKLFYVSLGQFNIASSQWIPFCVLYLIKAFRSPRAWRNWIMATLFLALQTWSELTYASFLVLFMAAYALGWLVVRLWRRGLRRAWRAVAGLLLLGALTLLAASPILAAMLPDMRAEGDFFVEGTGFADTFSADLLSFWVPTQLHPLLGPVARTLSFPKDKGQHLYLGYAALILAIIGLTRRPSRQQIFFAASGLAFALLALGPQAHLNGQALGPPLPFVLLQDLPFIKGNRYPGRFSVLVLLSLAMLASHGAYAILRAGVPKLRLALPRGRFRNPKATRVAGTAALAFFVVLENLSIPQPLSDMRLPPAYRAIQSMPGEDWTVLDLPLAWRNGFRVFGVLDPIFMYAQFYQTAHGGRLLSGNTSRNPELKFQYFVEAPILNSLVALENKHTLPPGAVEDDTRRAPDVLGFLGVRYVVVHKAKAPPGMLEYLAAVFPLSLLYEDQAEVVYRVLSSAAREGALATSAPGPLSAAERGSGMEVTFDRPEGRLSLAEGWSGASRLGAATVVWAQRSTTRLLIRGQGRALTLRVHVFAPQAGQVVRLQWSGRDLGARVLTVGWSEAAWDVPAELVRAGVNSVEMRWSKTYSPLAVAAGEAIGQTGVASPVHLYVRSAGLEVGWFAHIFVNGRDVSPGGRGYNVATIHPQTGAVESVASFDTHGDAGASRRLAEFLQWIPAGQIVIAAVDDEASMQLSEEAVAALRTIGAAVDLRGRFRWGHAVIGVKGASSGQALEGADLLRPVSLAVGQALSEPAVAGALDWLRVEERP